MSKYVLKFYVSTFYVRSATEETIDLVDDWGYSEEEASAIWNDEDKINELYQEWMYDNLDTGWVKVEEEKE